MQIPCSVLRSSLYLTLLLSIVILPVSAAVPAPDFSGTPASGVLPLTVSFTDSSSNLPTGWAWFFGDETYTQPWTKVNGSAAWTARNGHTGVLMPDGKIVLMGGEDSSGYTNDTWQSSDNGATWLQLNASAEWPARYTHTTVVMQDGSIVLMGGYNTNDLDDVWKSVDGGSTWSQVNSSPGWSARSEHASVLMPDNSIVLIGGWDGGFTNDVWKSADSGSTWTRLTAAAEWTARLGHSSVVMPDGSIVLMGGYDGAPVYLNDVWKSTDDGATWTQVNASAEWVGRKYHTSVVMPDGSIILSGGTDAGGFRNDTWRSKDNGATWTQVNASAAWTARHCQESLMMPDGSIVLFGGNDGTARNDVWKIQPVGSSLQNPSHTYTATGTYNVSLQAFNTDGYDSIQKALYITVTAVVAPVASFTGTPTAGTAPLAVTFTDTSTNTPTSWNWSFGDGVISTLQNPSHTYTTTGTYTVALNATNAAGSNTTTRAAYISVTAPAPPPATASSSDDDGGGAPAPQQKEEPPAPAVQLPEVQQQQLPAAQQQPAPTAPEVAPVEGLAGVTVIENYPVGYAGLSYNTVGDNTVSIDLDSARDAGAVVTVYFDRVTSYQHNSPGVLITFWGDRFQTKDGKITGEVDRAELQTDPLVVNVSGGKVAGSMKAELFSIGQPVEVENAITGDIPLSTAVQYNALLAPQNRSVAGIAYLMKFQRGNLTSTGAANVTMTVPSSWVDLHGGKDAVRITRTSDETGMTELLATTFTGADPDGNMIFRGDSPHGTSLFGLITSQATTAEKKAHPNQTYVPPSKPALVTQVGMFNWIAQCIQENPVLVVVLIALLAAALYFGWWKRKL